MATDTYVPTERFVVYMRSGSGEHRTEFDAHMSASAFVELGAKNVHITHERGNGRGGFDTLWIRPVYSKGETVTLKDNQHWTARTPYTVMGYGLSDGVPHYYLRGATIEDALSAKCSDVDGHAQEDRS